MRLGVLEDDLHLQKLYQLWFESANHSCKCYGTAKAFLESLSNEAFDILIIDWILPDSTGFAVLMSMTYIPEGIPEVF